MVDIEKHFAVFLEEQKLHGHKLLLMISGGVDSRVLLHVAQRIVAPANLHVCHVNHNTRETSRRDEVFVQKLCSMYGIACTSTNITDIPESNTEAVWRVKRRSLAQTIAQKNNCHAILTAHHATDLVETMLFRLIKGCGMNGLSPFDRTTKPFWNLKKDDLIAYAHQEQLEWVTDETNADPKYDRNKIRLLVLPHLREINPNLEQTFVRMSQTFRDAEDFIQNNIPSTIFVQGEVPLADFLDLHPILQTTLLQQIADRTCSATDIDDCLRWVRSDPEGNTSKILGGTQLSLQKKKLSWKKRV